MATKLDSSVFYSFDAIRSRQCVYNFIVGGRGIGKTYGAKKMCIRDFLEKGRQFVWVRRYKDELKTVKTFFADILHEFPDFGFKVDGQQAMVTFTPDEDKPKYHVMGYFLALSTAGMRKSVAYPKVHTIVFDEFIIEKGNVQYLASEARVFNDLFMTVDRFQDRVSVYFLANSVSIQNPYFIEYKIEEDGREFQVKENGFICIQYPRADNFKDAVKKTRFGRFIAGTEYESYSVGNVFRDNHQAMLLDKPASAIYAGTIESDDGTFSMWQYRQDGDIFWHAQQKRPKVEKVFTTIPAQMSSEKMLLTFSDPLMSMWRTAFKIGRVTFDASSTRNAFANFFKR